jgi:HSP20 family protein
MAEDRAVQRWPDVFDLMPRRFIDWLGAPGAELERELKVEEFTDNDQHVIRAELPGINPDKDIDIHIRGHALEIRAERREEKKSEEGNRYRSEFRYGSFFRRVPLSPDTDEHDVKATYQDGILEVRLPVEKKQAEATRIAVTRP